MSNVLLAVSELKKKYRNKEVLHGISLEVYESETVGLLGSNGAGKTTCFKILAGIVLPNSGTVSFKDETITNLPIEERARKGIGMLPQERSVFAALNVIDNVRAVLEIQSELSSKEINEKAIHYLNKMGIEHLAKADISQLSGGEIRRLEIARALVSQPNLLLLDEPFAAIDPITVNDLQVTLKELRNSGISLIISDHNVRETLAICDRAYIIHKGEVLCSGVPEEITANEQVREHYLGSSFEL